MCLHCRPRTTERTDFNLANHGRRLNFLASCSSLPEHDSDGKHGRCERRRILADRKSAKGGSVPPRTWLSNKMLKNLADAVYRTTEHTKPDTGFSNSPSNMRPYDLHLDLRPFCPKMVVLHLRGREFHQNLKFLLAFFLNLWTRV